MRRSIARVTASSAATIPQFHVSAELDATALLALREHWLSAIQAENGARLSITDIMLRAMALALVDCPWANAIWRDDSIEPLSESNVGLVVALDDGLLIPTVREPGRSSLAALAKQRTDLTAAARQRHLGSADHQPAATSLSNLGTTRVDDFAALIFPPQSTILAAGRIVPRPWVVGSELRVRPTLRLTMTVDHRVLDGAAAAQFLGRIVRYLEEAALLAAVAP